jgi:hypothetical protein
VREAATSEATALARAAREVAAHTVAAREASADARAMRAVALCGSVRCVRQRSYARPSRQRGARLHTPSDDEEDGVAVKKKEQDVAKKNQMVMLRQRIMNLFEACSKLFHGIKWSYIRWRKEEHDGALSDLILGEPNSTTMPKYSMQQAFPWFYLLMLLHNELVMVVVLVFPICPSSYEEFWTCWLHELLLFLSKLDEVLNTFCL